MQFCAEFPSEYVNNLGTENFHMHQKVRWKLWKKINQSMNPNMLVNHTPTATEICVKHSFCSQLRL